MSNCPYCGKLTDLQLDSCVHCGGFLKKQGGRPGRPGGAQTSQTCPSCGALVREGDIICVACGTNLLTGQKVADEKQAAVQPRSGPSSGLMMALGIVAVILLVVVGALVYLVFLQDPVAKAQALREEGQLAAAVKLLEEELDQQPDNARAHMELGKIYWAAQDYGQAGTAFEKVYRLQNDNVDAAWYAVLSYASSTAANGKDNIASLLEQVLVNDPGNNEARYLLAVVQGTQGQHEAQEAALQQLYQRNPNSATLQKSLGVAMALNGKAQQAEPVLMQATAMETSDADARAALGVAQVLQGKLADAETNLQAAVDGNTSVMPEVLTELGMLLVSQGKYGAAEPLLSDAVAARPDNAAAKFYHAFCLARRRQPDEALETFESLARGEGPYAAESAAQAAMIYLEKGDADGALRSVDSAPTGNPGMVEAELQTARGRANLALGDVASAMESFRNALRADDNYAPAHLEMGLALLQGQQLTEGINRLERYLALVDSGDPASGAREIEALLDQLRKTGGQAGTALGMAEPRTER